MFKIFKKEGQGIISRDSGVINNNDDYHQQGQYQGKKQKRRSTGQLPNIKETFDFGIGIITQDDISLPEPSGQFFQQSDFAQFDIAVSNYRSYSDNKTKSHTTRETQNKHFSSAQQDLTSQHGPPKPRHSKMAGLIDSDSEEGSIQMSPAVYSSAQETFDTDSNGFDFEVSRNNSTNVSSSQTSSRTRETSSNYSARSSPPVEIIQDSDSSYELGPNTTHAVNLEDDTEQALSTTDRMRSFLPFMSYKSLRDKTAEDNIKGSQESEKRGLVQDPRPTSRYYNTQKSDYLGPSKQSKTQAPILKSPRAPARRTSTTFSKKLIFSDTKDESQQTVSDAYHSSKAENNGQNEESEQAEDESLLPLNFASPPVATYRARRSSLPLNASSKVMTKSQFEIYKKNMTEDEKNPRNIAFSILDSRNEQVDDSAESMTDEEESEDEDTKKLKKRFDDGDASKDSARMRLKQDAHLSVYRQKMTKITGSQTPVFPVKSSTMSNFGAFDDDEEADDEYDEVPLGILKAHGFPSTPARPTLRNSKSHSELLTGNSFNATNYSTGTPSILYQAPNFGNPETASLRSYRSFATLPRKSPSPSPGLPSIFGNPGAQLNRGLVGEIAREEEAKQRRRTLGYPLAPSADYKSSMTLAADAYPPETTANNRSSNGGEIQAQLQQMMQMQMHMLQRMQGPGAQTPMRQTMMPPMGSGQSVRSMATGISRPMSIDQLGQFAARQSGDMSTAGSFGLGVSGYRASNMINGSGPKPMSSTNLSQRAQNIEDSDDDDDGDEGWKKMMEKRQALKDGWTETKTTVPVS